MCWKRLVDKRLLAVIGLLFGMALLANTATAPGSAKAAASCQAAVTNGDFGTVDLKAGGSATTTATLTFTCSGLIAGTPVTLCPNIDGGSAGYSGSTRLLAGPSSSNVNFQIYQDAARTQTWGTAYFLAFGAAPTISVNAKADGTINSTATLYASLPTQASATPGVYLSTFTGESFIWGLNLLSCAGVTIGTVITPPAFTFTATIAPNCTVTANPIAFGTHGVLTAPLTAQGSISLACTPNTAYTVGLSGGLSNGAPTSRLMTKGSESIQYGLYLDAALTQPWGAVGQGQGSVASGTGTGSSQSFTVYAQTPAQNTPSPGLYSDTVVATLTF